jgi:hypothetical protein
MDGKKWPMHVYAVHRRNGEDACENKCKQLKNIRNIKISEIA